MEQAWVLRFPWLHEALFWYSLFFLGLLPVSQVIPMVTLMNERYLYFPMLGAAPLLLWPLRNAEIFTPTKRVLATFLAIILKHEFKGLKSQPEFELLLSVCQEKKKNL